MGLEYRNGFCYYTRSKRVNGKVQREYISSGSMALLDASLDEAERIKLREVKRLEQKRWQREQEDSESLDAAVNSVSGNAVVMFQASMETAGFHQHSRGEWRKKRQEVK